MSFLKKLRSQSRPVRVATTWGFSLLIMAIIVPIWLSSVRGEFENGGSQIAVTSSNKGAIGLFFGSAVDDLRGRFGDVTQALGGAFGALRDGDIPYQLLENDADTVHSPASSSENTVSGDIGDQQQEHDGGEEHRIQRLPRY